MLIDRRHIALFDWGLLGFALLIPACGLLVLYSAGYDPDQAQRVFSWIPFDTHSTAMFKQLAFIFMGLAAMLTAMAIPPAFLHRYAYIFYAGCVLLLALVLIVGSSAKGAQRWLVLGGLTFQPSELMKLGAVLGLARYLARNPPKPGGYGFADLIVPVLLICVPMALIMAQPDLGTALSVGVVSFSMVLFMGIRIKALAAMSAAVVLAVIPAWEWLLRPYQKRRVLVLFNPEADPLGSGYHIIQSKIAVGSGSFLGKGLLHGTQSQLEFLPEHTTDFIFSVLAEEWGFVGALFVLLLFAGLLYRMLRIVMRSKELFPALVAFGVAAQIFFNAIINVGMGIGLLPVVGMPLPLFSYGGTSLVSTMFGLGLALGVGMRRLAFLGR